MMFQHMLNTLPHFLAYFGTAIALVISFLAVFVTITPHREFALIRDGSTSSAVQLIGTVLGFVIPLSVVIGHSVSISDMIAWGLVVLIVQVLTFLVIQFLFKHISLRITDDCLSSGIFVGGMALAIGILQAGCMIP